MTSKEVAEYLKIHQITVCKHAATGKIPAKHVGRLWRFDKAAIDKWIRAGGRSAPQTKKESKTKATTHILRKRADKKGKATKRR